MSSITWRLRLSLSIQSEVIWTRLVLGLRETSNRPIEQGIVLSQQLARLDDADRTLLLETVERLVERLARPG